MGKNVLIEIKHLEKRFSVNKALTSKVVGYVKAINDVSFDIYENETLGLVGESGCGKSTTGNCIVRLLTPDAGNVIYHTKDGNEVDLAKISLKEMNNYRSEIQMIFQDPYSSLDPHMTTRDIISEPLRINTHMNNKEINDTVKNLMNKVGLSPEYMSRYPHAFSGGQRQRIGIARALSLNPRFVICDESLSSLDVSIQAQMLDLLQKLREEYNMTYLFIAHDLSVIKHICQRVVVMYVGKIVEIAETNELFEHPLHPYTEALLNAIPKMTEGKLVKKKVPEGEVPDPSNPPEGCFFHPRCPYMTEECKQSDQALLVAHNSGQVDHLTTCIYYEKLKLKGNQKK